MPFDERTSAVCADTLTLVIVARWSSKGMTDRSAPQPGRECRWRLEGGGGGLCGRCERGLRCSRDCGDLERARLEAEVKLDRVGLVARVGGL